MDKHTRNVLNKARVCLANGTFDQLIQIVDSLPPDVLCGTVFDRSEYTPNKEYVNSKIDEYKNYNGIIRITAEDIEALNSDSNNTLSEKELERSFISIENNIKLFENKYKNKIYNIKINHFKSVLVSISSCTLFHLLGFNFFGWQEEYKDDILMFFPEFKQLLSMSYKEICLNEDNILYDALYTIVGKKNIIIDAIVNKDKNITRALNISKVKVKNFMFERSDFTGSPSGIILNKPVEGYFKSDTYIIKDFINQNSQEWSYFGFRDVSNRPFKCSESILYNYLPPEERDNYDVEIIRSIDVYNNNKDLKNGTISSRIDFGDIEIDYLKTKLFKNNRVVKVKKKNIR